MFVFEAAARTLSFKRAAMELNVTQPSVSLAIKTMEKHCKVILFIRDNRGVRLTEAGAELYDDVRAGFRRIEQTLENISERGTKYLSFAASTTLAAHWLAPQVYHFQQIHPDIRLKIVVTDRDVEPDHEIDVTIWIRKRDFNQANTWFISDEVIFPVCSPAYLAAHPQLHTIEDLNHHQLIHSSDAHRKRMSWSEWIELAGGDPSQIRRDIVFTDYQLGIQAALLGEGVALGWSFTNRFHLDNGSLIRPLPHQIETGRAFFLVANDRIGESEKTKKLLDWVLAQSKVHRSHGPP
ncbi:LysR substrate-binding domain-containing protein [Mesorhizobium waimense]|uniref:LysR substrate-binding domain-containing protein n=1 Tax=Mesorhizobium waimense TaxID=1300307 RepID=UPI00142D7DA1|nr:LysR substrate-binding domain-containing protein [Mesorhizobium waimense]